MKIFSLLIFTAACVFAAPAPPIGIVTASGHFTLQGSEVWGNATLFDGSTVETRDASSQLALRSGVKLQLGAGSRAQIFSDRVMLEQGVGQIGALRVRTEPGSRVRIGFGPRIEVAALTGVARVSNADVTLAAIQAPNKMSFAPQTPQQMRTGCLLYKNGQFILQDDNTQEVIQLNGQDLAANVGNRVEITGAGGTGQPTVAPATAIFNVTAVSPRSQGGCLVVASSLQAEAQMPAGAQPAAAPAKGGGAGKAAGAGGAAAGAAVGLSIGAKIGIIAGVAAAGGTAAAVAAAHSKSSTSP